MNTSIPPFSAFVLGVLLLGLAGPSHGTVLTGIRPPVADSEVTTNDMGGAFETKGTVIKTGTTGAAPSHVKLKLWKKNEDSGAWGSPEEVDFVLEQAPELPDTWVWDQRIGSFGTGEYKLEARAWDSSDDTFLGNMATCIFRIKHTEPDDD